MQTYIRSKSIGSLTKQETSECRRLTMGSIGEMQKNLDRERRHSKPPFTTFMPATHEWARAVMIRSKADGKLLGWALIIYVSGEPSAHFYVHKDCRRRGLGRSLHRHVERFGPDAYCFPPGRRSRAFFRAVGACIDPEYV